jgi:hypothetical protein
LKVKCLQGLFFWGNYLIMKFEKVIKFLENCLKNKTQIKVTIDISNNEIKHISVTEHYRTDELLEIFSKDESESKNNNRI